MPMIVRSRFSADIDHTLVTVVTGSRIHLGFYGFDDEHRMFGGLGLALTRPSYRLTAWPASEPRIEGCQSNRVKHVLENIGANNVSVRLEDCIPPHVGLGSTTQLNLAVYVAVEILKGGKPNIFEAAKKLGRGRVSGVGVAVFANGGFIVDAGYPPSAKDYVVKPMLRLRFPTSWGIVVAVPKTRWRVSEAREPKLFEKVAGSLSRSERLYLLYLVFRRLIPSLIDRDYVGFTSALEEVQKLTGQYFSGAQEGIFCCTESETVATLLHGLGGRGVGQSSWGPLVYAFYPTRTKAVKAHAALKKLAEREGVEIEFSCTPLPRNHGAVVEVLRPAKKV